MTLDLCYGGCGGIWFDPGELRRIDAKAAASLHTVWQAPPTKGTVSAARLCPRCPNQELERKWFSEARQVEIDRCPACGGVWLDAGEFTRIQGELGAVHQAPPAWAAAMAAAAASVKSPPAASD
jgi:Zn-finger nucleic acid-binding protein